MSLTQHQKHPQTNKPFIMDTITVTTTIHITKAGGISTTQINKLIQGTKQCHCFPVEARKNKTGTAANKQKEGSKKRLTVTVDS